MPAHARGRSKTAGKTQAKQQPPLLLRRCDDGYCRLEEAAREDAVHLVRCGWASEWGGAWSRHQQAHASDFSILKICPKARPCKIEARLKTQSALRDVDLHPAIAKLLKEFVGERKSGFLFSTRSGKPIASSNVIRRHLHAALEKLKYVNPHTETHKAGNHAFRRLGNTYLRNRTACPEGFRNYWMGHAGESMSDLYDKVKEDVSLRKKWAAQCGFGFELPSVVPNIPKNNAKTKVAKSA